MADYSFLTTWLLDSPREPVFEALYDQARWPQWWRGVEEAEEIRPGPEDGDGVGTVSRMVWKSLLPYRVEFEVTTTHVERPHLLQADAVGELTGVGRWRLFERRRRHRRPLRVERRDDQAVDESDRADRPSGLRVESRLGDGARGRGNRKVARLPPPGKRLTRPTAIFKGDLALA